jgi:hypothetical protein
MISPLCKERRFLLQLKHRGFRAATLMDRAPGLIVLSQERLLYAPIAQRIEHRSSESSVGGSNPSGCASLLRGYLYGLFRAAWHLVVDIQPVGSNLALSLLQRDRA